MTTALLYAAGVVIFLVALFASIALHELGHFATARRFGCRITEFMIGFGPVLFRVQRGETSYGFRLIPLGGYVKIIGMFPPGTEDEHRIAAGEIVEKREEITAAAEQATEEQPLVLRSSSTGLFPQFVARTRAFEFEQVLPSDRDRLFYKLPAWKKVTVMAAGPVVNLLIAFVCFQAVFGIHGTNVTEPVPGAVIAEVSQCVIPEQEARTECTSSDPASPAALAGLEPGDQVVSFNGAPVTSWEQLSTYIQGNGAGAVQLTVVRDGAEVELEPTVTATMTRNITPLTDPSPSAEPVYEEVGFLGASPVMETTVVRHGPIFTLTQMADMSANALSMIVQLPAKVWNVAMAVAGFEERSPEGPMSVIGGSRVAGEVASSDAPFLDTGSKAAMLGTVIGSFNLFIGLFNLIPLMPFDGGHIAGSVWEGLRRRIAALRRQPDPGHVNVAAQQPIAIVLGLAMVVMGFVLMLGDLLVPLSSGF